MFLLYSMRFWILFWGFTILTNVTDASDAKFRVCDPSRLSRSCRFQHCRVFAHRVSKMPLRRMWEDAEMRKRLHLPSSGFFQYCGSKMNCSRQCCEAGWLAQFIFLLASTPAVATLQFPEGSDIKGGKVSAHFNLYCYRVPFQCFNFVTFLVNNLFVVKKTLRTHEACPARTQSLVNMFHIIVSKQTIKTII